ncbi:hypothetical protein [Nitrososphaera sp.]|uniref:hypothetical protein n=1 Tax=Nitrososphaera sp. TaxID=1971748 RepID=UPI00307F25C1
MSTFNGSSLSKGEKKRTPFLISGVLMIIIVSTSALATENVFAANIAANAASHGEMEVIASPQGNCTYQNVTVESLKINSINRTRLKQPAAGSQVSLEATIIDDCNAVNYPFMILVEVRDSAGVTHHLAWQKFTISPGEHAKVGFSWTADGAGDYEMRAWSIHCPTCIGYYPVRTMDFTVKGRT